MLHNTLGFFQTIIPLDESILLELESHFEIFDIPARHKIIEEGQVCKYIYIHIKGISRMYYMKDDEEICSLLIEENYPFTVPDSFYSGNKSYQTVESLEPGCIARIHIDSLKKLYSKYLEVNYIARVITEKYFVKSEERLFLLRKKTTEERYLYFIEKYPSLLLRVPLKHIASYLGMSLETLSRCRKKIQTKM